MKRAIVVLGVVLIVIGLFFAYETSLLGGTMGAIGLSPTQNILDRNVLVQISPSNYTSSVRVPLTSQDSLSLSFKTSPAPVDFFLMNQGNYSRFSAGNGSAYAVYPQSQLNVSTYALTFNETSFSGDLFLVFVSHGVSTDVLMHLTDNRTVPSAVESGIPIVIAIAGILVVGLGLFSGGRKSGARVINTTPSPRMASVGPKCKFCGASLRQGEVFCHTCGKAQQ
ncbi:MAG TPA: zinc ribbon domain-containing protein [Nitrososphaerales archaeon]|nr:zinc ribbon domain-containing protein [Nitrososphaerales archaeon]